MRLLGHQWLHDSIPADLESLARICRTDGQTMAGIWEKVGACFVEAEDGRLQNTRLAEQRKERDEFIEKSRQAGKKSAEKRQGRLQSGSNQNPTDPHVWLEPNANSASASPSSSTTHTNAGASENESPPTTPPSTDDGGFPTTEPEEAILGPPPATATRRGVDARALKAWGRWNALGLPLPESVPEEDHLAGLTRLFTGGTRTWRLSEVFQAMQRLKDEPDEWEWVTRNGPGYLSHRPRGQPQVIEQVLTRKTRRGSEAGSSGSHHRESVEERVKRIVGAT